MDEKGISVKRLMALLLILLLVFVIITGLLDAFLLGKKVLFFKFDLYLVRIIEVTITIIVSLPFTYKHISSINIFGTNLQVALKKVSVEYKEFKDTLRPLISFELTKIETEGRMYNVFSIDSLLDFISKTEKIVDSMYAGDEVINGGLFRARLKVIELSATNIANYIVEFKLHNYYVDQGKNISLFDLVRQYIQSGLSDSEKIGEIKVDVDGLKQALSHHNIDWGSKSELVKMLNDIDKYYHENKDKFLELSV